VIVKVAEPREVGPLSRTDLVRYQGASGDMNPLHHDEEFCRRAGLPMPIAPGMLAAGVLASWVVSFLPPEDIRRYRVRFEERVWPGDFLTCSGSVVREYEEAGERRVDLEMTCCRQTGGVAVRGWATFVLGKATWEEETVA
jgi:acyl dehydratase